MTYLLDTCILSKLRKLKSHPDKTLSDWIQKHKESAYCISVLSLGEIQMGISKLDHKNKERQKQKMVLEDWLFGELVPRFQNRILDVTQQITFTWGNLLGQSQQKGFNVPAIDGLIAATALHHGLIVVTDNIKHFQELNIEVFNPCERSISQKAQSLNNKR
jgi:predicted nucleic acid-binding protein